MFFSLSNAKNVYFQIANDHTNHDIVIRHEIIVELLILGKRAVAFLECTGVSEGNNVRIYKTSDNVTRAVIMRK